MAGYPLRKLVRFTSNNQVVIPAPIARHLKLVKGSYLEVEEKNRRIVMTPKRFVDEETFAMYEEIIKKGRTLHGKGETVDWEEVKKKLDASE
jgi:AbrB family looped-hinge helix DNA binding protein